MSFDFVSMTVCIGYSEPALWIAVLVVAALSLPVGSVTGRRLRALPSLRLRLVVGFVAGLLLAVAALVVEVVLLQVVFALLHPADPGVTTTVCTTLVGPVVVAAPILAWVATTLVAGSGAPHGAPS